MAKIRLTKNELKKQKDSLKRFNQFLPTLILKKQQLQSEVQRIHREIEVEKKAKAYEKAQIYHWVDVFAEEIGFDAIIHLEKVETTIGNIAGIDIPIFSDVIFTEEEYNMAEMPIWVDHGVEALKNIIRLNVRIEVLRQQEGLVDEELRTTTQRVNLFEKIMIPQTRENIRKIRIYLGDIQTAAVVTGKIAKEKILRNAAAAAGL